MESSLAVMSNDLVSLVSRVAPSVVVVDGRSRGPASGVVWRKNLVVTAEHAVQRDEDLALVLPDGNRVPASLVGRDAGTDLALLRAETLPVPPLDVPQETESRVGDIVLVIGRSPNSGPNASMGIISGLSGPWRTWRGGQLDRYVRLDATVFPGSSGGAVVNYRGRIIGLATSALSRVAGLAIPVTTMDRVIDILLEKGGVPQGYLGVSLQPVRLPDALVAKAGSRGPAALMVFGVEPAGPADKSGIMIGDILLEVDGNAAGSIEELQAVLGGDRVGKSLPARILRGGETRSLTITVGQRPTGERK